ncbi:LysR family transcriptional regulator [Corynebacterium breve]|uniref:LysR family transcriptional regulator n=1 Tax=Corynebacterium breve TaxID=3049799 RepID=A0ABY8VDZ6_9CORY|nr:LysR family transcriptional regulator [Corynebacterium breve]WIM67557.1 LysR family transcriptional regulator [Corynebacterium breve]
MTPVDLEGFLLVAKLGHLTAAAERLHVPQPTLSRRVQRVEKHVGAELFDRVGGRMELNGRGRAFVPRAEAVLTELAAGRTQVARLMDPEQGTVRLDFMHSLGTWMVPDLLRDYRAEHPHVEFVLHQGPGRYLAERVFADHSDLALIGPRPNDDRLGWLPLATQRLAVAFSAEHPLASAEPIRLADAADEPWVGMLPGYGTRTLLDDLVATAGFTPKFVFESMELTTVAGLVSAGLGVALLPLDDPYLAVSGVVLRAIDPPAFRELGLVWRREASSAPPVDQFRKFVASRMPSV